MKVKIKKLVESAIIPQYAKPGDAGMDLYATSKIFDKYGNLSFGTGLAIEIPEGYVGLLFPRSSCAKTELLMANSVGVIDSGYRGEVSVKFKPSPFFASIGEGEAEDTEDFEYIALPSSESDEVYTFQAYDVGDRIAQLIILPYPNIEFEESEELSDTERGDGSYGSTGK